MLLSPSDPDIDTIIRRIQSGDLDLQPDFQRGEVWSLVKKRKLIDSILRNWYVPPIHTIVLHHTKRQDVLDGQQRLAAIRDFVADLYTVDGQIQPHSLAISQLDGLRYSQLPDDVRRGFDSFTLRIIRISDYAPEEPGELFFRLNTLTNITSAEQRNAFYGPVRDQVKELVAIFENNGNNQETIGFSNSRMAYDDVISKLLCVLETHDMTIKLTAGAMSDRYRKANGFSDSVLQTGFETLKIFGNMKPIENPVRFNKASLLSWLIVVANYVIYGFGGDMTASGRLWLSEFHSRKDLFYADTVDRYGEDATNGHWNELFQIYNDRSTSRVSDVSSIVYRDFVINYFLLQYGIPFPIVHQRQIWPFNPQRGAVFKDFVNHLLHRRGEGTSYLLEHDLDLDLWGKF